MTISRHDKLAIRPGHRAIAVQVVQLDTQAAAQLTAQQLGAERRALEIARGRHGSCRGVLGEVSAAFGAVTFECCDCHDLVRVSLMEAAA